MEHTKLQLLLADDDLDDCDFFRGALLDVPHPLSLTVVKNGVELMDFLLEETSEQPDVIFLDLNMPRKNGIECVEEIKASNTLKHIPIIVFSTSLDKPVINKLYELGAHHYIQKPSEFSSLKRVIKKAVMLFSESYIQVPSRDQFIIQP